MKEKIKVAMVVDVYDSLGGGFVSTKRFTELLRKNGHKVVVISTGKVEKDKVVLKKYYPPVFKKIMKDMNAVFALPNEKKMKAVFKNVDLVHVQMPFYLGIKAITYAKELGLPVVVSFHVQAENITKNLRIKYERVIKMIYKFFLKHFYNRADVVVCPSLFAKQELQRFGLKAPAVVVSNGYPDIYHPVKVEKKQSDKFVVLTVGRLAIEKNQSTIIDGIALSKHKDDIELVIVGDGPLRNVLRKRAQKLNNVKFLGAISNKKLLVWYNKSDIYVHGGLVELEGMTALEAMACGLPILVSDSSKSATKQFALTNKSKFSDAKDLAKKIDYWYEHPKELANAKKEYLKSVKKYDIHKSVETLESAYRQAIKTNKSIITSDRKIEKDGEKAWKRFLKYILNYRAKRKEKKKVKKLKLKKKKSKNKTKLIKRIFKR